MDDEDYADLTDDMLDQLGRMLGHEVEVPADVLTVYETIKEFWVNKLGARFIPPKLIAYNKMYADACGINGEQNAGFCAINNTITYDVGLLNGLTLEEITVVFSHEMGHAVAAFHHRALPLRKPQVGQREELRADCLSGVYAGNLPDIDVKKYEHVFSTLLADDSGPDKHGLASERLAQWRLGLTSKSVDSCKLSDDYSPRDWS